MQYPQASLPGLPLELRLTILSYALHNTRIEIRHQRPKSSHNNNRNILPSASSWSLLHICSQIRHEAIRLFFESCHFHFFDTLTEPDMSRFLLEIVGGEAIGWMETVSFHTKAKCMMFGLGGGCLPAFSDFADGWMSDTFDDSSDYCLRDLTLNLKTDEDIYNHVFETRLWSNHNPRASTLCSNKAFGCREQTYEAFKEAGLLGLTKAMTLNAATLMRLWEVMNLNNSAGAA